MGRRSILLLTTLALCGPARAGSTRCWIDQGAVVVAAAFGDIAGDFVVDIGAPVSALHVTAANAHGITSESVELPLTLAGRRLASARMKVVDLDGLPPIDTNIAGVIGADVLSRYPVTIQFAPCRLTWGTAKVAWGALRLPVTLANGAPTLAAELTDGVTVRDRSMIVSTGRTETLVPAAFLSRILKAGSSPPVRLRAVVVGGRLLEQVPAGVAQGVSGSIGTGVWRRWRSLTLDFGRGRLELAPLHRESKSPAKIDR